MVWSFSQRVKVVVIGSPTQSAGNGFYGFELARRFENSSHHIEVLKQVFCGRQIIGILPWSEA